MIRYNMGHSMVRIVWFKNYICEHVSLQAKIATLFKSHKCVLFDQFKKQSLYYEFVNRLQKDIQRQTFAYQNKSLKDYKE